jgi:toxin HigB-1
VITSFSSDIELSIWKGTFTKKIPPLIQKKARMKLRMINNAHSLEDLKNPPGNHLELLLGDREG